MINNHTWKSSKEFGSSWRIFFPKELVKNYEYYICILFHFSVFDFKKVKSSNELFYEITNIRSETIYEIQSAARYIITNLFIFLNFSAPKLRDISFL